uniref:Fibronectin type-III domain-containing protein n=2 Tax=Panagrolaimus sp. JU765 TaxID=591449 RepID=A0AC34QHM4_9BILA
MYGGKTNQFITPTERKFISMDGTLFFSYNQKDDATSYACSLSLMSTQSGHYGPFFRLILPEAIPGPSSAPKIDDSQPQIFPEIPTFGQSVYIECFAFGFPAPKYKWMRTDGEPLSSRHRILNYGRVLKIDNVQIEDANRYKCVATNELGSDSAEIQLVIHSRPTILRPMVDQRAATNTSASFECAVTNRNNGHLSIEWFHDGQPIAPLLMPATDRKRFKIHENILTILNIVENDSGIYQCIVSNEVGSVSTAARLTVEDVAPIFHGNIFPRRIFIVEGSNLSLPCLYFASPRGFSQWYAASSDLISMESNARVRQKKSRIVGEESLSILEIDNIEKNDEGVYHCETTNGVGEAQGTVEIKVMSKPQFYVRPPSLSNAITPNTMSNSPAKVTCEVELACEHPENCPEALFDWQFNDRKIRSLVTKGKPLKTSAHEKEAKNDRKDDASDKRSKKTRQISELEVTPSFASANIGRFSCNSIYGSGSSELNEPKTINVSPTQLKIIEIRKTQAKLSWKQPANQQRRGFGNNFRMEGYQIEYRTEDDRQWRIFPNGLFKTEDRIVGSYTVRDLVPNQKYQFRIRTRAVDGVLSAPSSHSDWIQTAASPPLDPIQKLRWKTIDNTHLLLEWDPIEFNHRSGPNLRYNVSWSDPTQKTLKTTKNLGDAFSHFELVSEPSFVITLKPERQKKKKVSKKKGLKQDDDSCYTLAVGVQPINDIGTGPSSTDTVVHITSEGPKRYAHNLLAIPVNSTHLNLTWEWKNAGECENVLGAQIRCIESQSLPSSRASVHFAVNHSDNDVVSLVSKNSDPLQEDEMALLQVNYSVPAHYSSFLAHSLKAATEYSCTVQAFDQFGRYGNTSTHAAFARTFDSAPLLAPEITRIKLHEQESGYITLMEWTVIPLRNNLYNDVTNHQRGYKIFIYVSETAENPVILTLTEAELQNSRAPSARIDGLKLMYFYTVKVAGFNEGGLGPLSKPTSIRLGMSGDINCALTTKSWPIWLFLTATFAIYL